MKKGFTLIELLAVIAVLAVILLVAVSIVTNVFNNAKVEAYKTSELMMKKAAKTYLGINQQLMPSTQGATTKISLEDLVNDNFISPIKNQLNPSEACEGYVIAKNNNNQITYIPYLECEDSYISNTIIKDFLIVDIPLGNLKNGSNYIDYSNYANDAIPQGTTLVNNRFNITEKATFINGATEYIEIPDISKYQEQLTGFTLSYWVKIPQFTTTYQTHIHRSNQATIGSSVWWAGLDNTNRITVTIGASNGAWSDGRTNIVPELDRWYHLAGTWDGSIGRVFIDGEFIMQYNKPIVTNKVCRFTLGRMHPTLGATSYFTHSIISDVMIYNKFLTADEIKHNYTIQKNLSN